MYPYFLIIFPDIPERFVDVNCHSCTVSESVWKNFHHDFKRWSSTRLDSLEVLS